MAFDTQAARKAGYSDDEIADYLSSQSGFDAAAARKAGYSSGEIIQAISTRATQPANDAKPDQGLTPLDTEQVTSARPWQGAGAGRGSPNDPRRVDVERKPEGGLLNEARQLRDETLMGVQQTGAAVSNINAFGQANRLANTEQLIRDLEARGRGDSRAANQLRAEVQSLQERLPATIGAAADANALSQAASQMTTRPAIRKVGEAKTFGEAWEAFKESPYDVIAGVTAQSLPQVLPGLIAAAVTGPAAGAAAMGLNSGAVEFGGSLTEFAQDKGIDTRNAKAVQGFYSDPGNLSEALKYAGTRAGIIGTVDAASGGIAGKTLAPALRSPIKRQAINLPAQMAVQGAAGGGGEAAAQLATKGEIDQPGQVLLEVAGELGGAPAEVAAFTRDSARAATTPSAEAARALSTELDAGQLDPARVETLNPNLAIQRKTQDGLINIGAAQTVDEAIAAATQATSPQDRAVDNIARILGETPNFSQPGDVRPLDSGTAGLGAPEPGIGLEAGMGTDGAAGRPLDAGGAGNQPDGGTVPLADRGPDAQLSPEPASMWFGRRGDGYQTPEDASAALPSRQKIAPDLSWKVEQMPSGRYRLAGYDTQTQQPASFKVTLNPTGTATIIGNPDAIKAKLAEAGIDKVMTGTDRVVVGTSQAQAAVQALEQKQPPALVNTAQPAIDSVANDQDNQTREDAQAQAPTVETPAPEGSDAPGAAAKPATAGTGVGVEAAGVEPAKAQTNRTEYVAEVRRQLGDLQPGDVLENDMGDKWTVDVVMRNKAGEVTGFLPREGNPETGEREVLDLDAAGSVLLPTPYLDASGNRKLSQPGKVNRAQPATLAEPQTEVPAEGAAAVEGAGVNDLDGLEAALMKERDSTTSEIENGWMDGKGRRQQTAIERAVYDAVTASVLDADAAAGIVETALKEGRADLALYAAQRAARAAESMSTTPGVSESSPKYEAIKNDLVKRKQKAQADAQTLIEKAAKGAAPATAPKTGDTITADGKPATAGTGVGVEAAGVEQSGFDPVAFDKARSETIQKSREAGNIHLDKVPPYVETMRGKKVYYAHDPKVRGTIRTVDNRGNVYINWDDQYSAEKELASPTQDGKKTVMQSSIGPRDLKDYVLATNPPIQDQTGGTPDVGAGVSQPMPVAAPQPTAEQKIREAFDSAPRTVGNWHKLTVEHNGKTQEFLANMKRVNTSGKRDSAIHLVNIRPGRMMAGDPVQDLAYYYKLDGKNNLVEEGIPSIATPEQLKAFGRADPRLIPVSQRKQAPYSGPADVSSRAGQIELANRGGRIASLKAMNEQLRKIAPGEAWADSNIESATDLDALQSSISQALVDAGRARANPEQSPLKARLDELSGQELRAVFDVMSLAGSRMTATERVNALLAENPQEVEAALDQVSPRNVPKKQANLNTSAEPAQKTAESEQVEANDQTPKQYHDARLRKMSDDTGTPLAEVREFYDTEGGRAESDRLWSAMVDKRARDGATLARQTLDKFYELNPTARLPETAFPNGYQRPDARKQEAIAKDAIRQDRREARAARAASEEQVGPYGRDLTPIAQGGKPFKNKAEADKFRTSTSNTLKTVRSPTGKGFAVMEKSAAEILRAEKAAKRLRQPNTGTAGEPLHAHGFIAADGGLSKAAMKDAGFDRNKRVGNRWLFSDTGMTIERATEKLIEAGYLRDGASHSDAFTLLNRSANQAPQYTPEGWERMAEAEQEARRLAAQDEANADAQDFAKTAKMLGESELDELDYAVDNMPELFEAGARLTAEEADAIFEEHDANNESAVIEGDQELEQADARAAPPSRGPGDRAPGRTQEGQGSAQETGITSQQLAAAQDELRILRGYANQRLIPTNTTLRQVITTPLVGADRAINVNAKRYGIARALGLKVERIRQPRSDALVLKIVEGDTPLLDKTVAEIAAMKFIIQSEKQEQPSPALREPLSKQEQKDNETGLTAPTQTDVLAQQDRAAQAEELDQRAQIDREASGFQLQTQTAEQRRENTGDMFGGPSVEDYQSAVERNRKPGTAPAGPDLFAEPEPQQEAPQEPAKPAAEMSAAELLRAAADKMEAAERPKTEPAKAPEKIDDIGEKIGGARKDTAVSTGTRKKAASEEDDRPTWAKRFRIAQVAGGFDVSVNGRDVTGKWTLSDTRTLDRMGQPKRMGEYFDSKEAAEAALPLLALAQKHRAVPVNTADGQKYEIWRDINDRKRVKVVDRQFDTRDEAMRYMAQNATQILETNTTFGEADLPKPESTQRKGVERRTGDVKGEDFRDTFGFRGVEFGLWNNQEERQEVMNAAYDGLLDLAEVLKVPPKAIGLNGDLALAFGARGKGLSGARAHYETDRVVMNLTKMNGAGALAHEWFHALDHYLARQDGKTTAEWKINKDGTRSLDVKGGEADMASSGFRRNNSGVREELRNAYTSLVQSLFSKAEQYVEDTARADKFVAVARGELEKELSNLRKDLSEQKDVRYYKRNNKPASAEQLAEFDGMAAELVEGRGLATEWKVMPGKSRMAVQTRHTNETLEKLNELYKAVRGRSGFNTERRGVLDSLSGYMTRYEQRLRMLSEANALTPKTKRVPTSFAMDAKSLDQGRGGDYWTSPHEMVARAFQGYVEDAIAAKEGRSPFLNYAPENAGILTPWGAKRPFPAGDERKAMNAEFDKFIDVLQTRETDDGNVAMFSRTPAWRSDLRDKVAAIKMESSKEEGWRAYISGLTTKGVKPDEIEWSGVTDWLKLQTGKVTKQQVLDYLDGNGVQVQEVVLGAQSNAEADKAMEKWGIVVSRNPEDENQVAFLDRDNPDDLMTADELESAGYPIAAVRAAMEIESGGAAVGATGFPKYSQYTLPGGTNYREVLLTLPTPADDRMPAAKKIGDAMARLREEAAPGVDYMRTPEYQALQRQMRELNDAPDPRANAYQSSHWGGTLNVIAHIRLNDRTDADGNRVLFVEEIQSDWGQDGKKKGFAANKTPKIEAKRVGPWNPNDPSGPSKYRMTVDGGDAGYVQGKTEAEAIERLTNERRDFESRVPVAPFVTSTDKWLSLALKRVITLAAQEGYDKVAFVNGEQSAERYDLSKQVEAIDWIRRKDGTYDIAAFPKGGGQAINKDRLSTGDVAGMIGKELADRITKEKGETLPMDWADATGTLKGLDLKVGGEGMRAFYDKILPNTLKDVLKKVGGGSLESVDIGVKERRIEGEQETPTGRPVKIVEHPQNGMLTIELDDGSYWGVFASTQGAAESRAQAERAFARISKAYSEKSTAQTGFTITPEMRNKAANGLPMFRPGAESAGMPTAEAQAHVTSLTKKWKNGPPITVVSTPADLPMDAPGDARGVYWKGKVWIVAGAHKTRADIARTLAHEAIAHYGLRNILGADEWRRFMANIQLAIKSGNKPLKDIQARVRRAYVDDSGRFNLTANQEADEIAAKVVEDAIGPNGEFRPGFGFVKSVYARIVEFLRDLGLDVKLTMAEVQGMLVLAQRNLEAGRRTGGGGEMVVAAARENGQNEPMANRKDVVESQGSGLAVRRLNKVMQEAGWEIEYVDMDLTAEKPTANIRINRDDGRFLIAKVDSVGRATMETFQRERGLRMDPGQRGRRPLSPMVDDVFLGRQKFEGARAMLRGMTNYLADNAINPVALSDMRSAWAAVMSGPVRQDAQQLSAPTNDGASLSRTPQTDTQAFKSWFGDSVVTDTGKPGGKPLVVYHGTGVNVGNRGEFMSGDFNAFDGDLSGKSSKTGAPESAFFFTDKPDVASSYTVAWRGDFSEKYKDNANVMPVYISMAKPLKVNAKGENWRDILYKGEYRDLNEIVQLAKESGKYDGVIVAKVVDKGVGATTSKTSTTYVAFNPTQIKSATGNNGNFDPSNPDIRFSRGAVEQAPEQPPRPNMLARAVGYQSLDDAGSPEFTPGRMLYNLIGDATGPWLSKWSLKAASPELRKIMRAMKIDVAKAQETAAAVAKESMALSQEEREMVSDLIEKELRAGVVPPEHAIRLAATINTVMGKQTDELLQLGMLSRESAERWRGEYLPRFYESKLTKQADDLWADAMRKLRGNGKPLKGIRGKHLRGRGMYEVIPVTQLADYETMGWEVRDPDYQPGLTDTGMVQVWRDFTRQERDRMGEIRDAGFRFVMGYMQTQKDIALGRMFEALASNPDMSSKYAMGDLTVQVPTGNAPGTEVRTYGKLAGRYVSPETLSQLSMIEEAQSEALMMYRKAMGLWKESKTVLNPVAHANNVISNITMAHFAGVSYGRVDKYLAAIRDFATKSDDVLEAKEAGLFLGTMNEAELFQSLPEELKALAQTQESTATKAGRTVFNLMTFYLRKPMGWAYQAEDTFFRYLIYKEGRAKGLETADAVDYAQKFIFTYDDLPKRARQIRDYGIPFFAYTYKAIPALLETALTHPERFAAPMAVIMAANAAAYAIAAGDDDDSWELRLKKYLTDKEYREKVREKEKLERELLPEWLRGQTSLRTERTVRLGTDELTKLPMFIDISRMIPGGDMFDMHPNGGGIPWFQPLTPNHPLLSMYGAMHLNKDAFYGKDIINPKTDSDAEAARKRLDWIWKQMTPAIAYGNYHWERWMNALAQATGEEIQWAPEWATDKAIATGIGRDGLPVQPKYAAMQTFGIKVRPYDLDKAEAIAQSVSNKTVREIDAEMSSLRRLNNMGAVSDRTYERAKELADTKKDRLRDGQTVDGEKR